jgi:adenylosuccinate synthase
MSQFHPIIVVQGGQWGSEAKGAIAAHICHNESVDIAVRTGAVNAGHTVEHNGQFYKMQQLPTGWVNPKTQLVLGAGALINPHHLEHEVNLIAQATGEGVKGVLSRLLIDHRATLHLPEHQDRSAASGRHHAIGATGKGCSEALVDKVKRRGDPSYFLWADSAFAAPYHACICDTAMWLNSRIDRGLKVLLEGTQGTHLDLHLGPYPYTTHKQCVAGQWAVEAGLSPALEYDVVLVLRTYPIRVAGNSGPMPREISWVELANRINDKLLDVGLQPIVHPTSIAEFEEALGKAAESLPHPDMSPDNLYHWANYQHRWPADTRVKYQSTLSELNRVALNSLPENVFRDLCNLFELTTVTRKLRRVAEFDMAMAREAVKLNRPSRIALTFLNYVFPEMWNFQPVSGGSAAYDGAALKVMEWAACYIYSLEAQLDTEITMVNTGPLASHIFHPDALSPITTSPSPSLPPLEDR